MRQVFLAARNFWRDEDGVTAIEYALVASLIAMAILTSVALLGQQVGNLYAHVKDCVLTPSTC